MFDVHLQRRPELPDDDDDDYVEPEEKEDERPAIVVLHEGDLTEEEATEIQEELGNRFVLFL